jgi:hypothetical protein
MKHRPEDFARQFPENGLKLLLQWPHNVRDALRIAHYKQADAIDYDHLQVDPTTYVQRDYRHLESDVVLRGPLLRRKPGVLNYILIEHQSEPDRLMPFRVLEYVLATYRGQLRDWSQQHPFSRFRLPAGAAGRPLHRRSPLAGSRAPRGPRCRGPDFAALAPILESVFLPLRDTPDRRLVSTGGCFGQVLRLVQQRHARAPAFRPLLGQVVQAVEGMPQTERLRWLDLLSYIHALVYHGREQGRTRRSTSACCEVGTVRPASAGGDKHGQDHRRHVQRRGCPEGPP